MIWQEKQRLRQEMRAMLAAMEPGERAAASEELRGVLAASPVWPAARTVFGFVPLRDEPDWIGLEFPEGRIFACPRVGGDHLTFHRVNALAELVAGVLGTRHPADDAEVLSEGDLILVPGLAFDRSGRRLGRGRGFYDRFLAGQSAFKLGVCFSGQVVEEVPREDHDAVVDAVVTENEWITARPGPAGSPPAAPPDPL